MFRLAICDDNEEFISQEIRMADQYFKSVGIEYDIKSFLSGNELIDDINLPNYDLILLDYEMNGINGFETARLIKEKSAKTHIAFVTVFYEFSRDGYRYDAIRYLVKQDPDFENELYDCINKAIQIKNRRKRQVIAFRFVDKTVKLNVEDIVYIESSRHYLFFYVIENNELVKYMLRDKLSNIAEQLNSTHLFTIVRRGILINLKYVIEIDRKGFVRLRLTSERTKLFQSADSRKNMIISDYMRYIEQGNE